VHWYQVSIDVDDEVRAVEALRSSKRQLEQMIDALPINILSFAPSGRITYASKRYLDNVGVGVPRRGVGGEGRALRGGRP
jgi:PAS domain-containing protein